MQITLHYWKVAAVELQLNLLKANMDIILVLELYIFNNRVSGINGKYFMVPRPQKGTSVDSVADIAILIFLWLQEVISAKI